MLETGSLLDADRVRDIGSDRTLDTGLAAGADRTYDLDAEITLSATNATPMITSKFICTPGCTSPGGGSFCSYCC